MEMEKLTWIAVSFGNESAAFCRAIVNVGIKQCISTRGTKTQRHNITKGNSEWDFGRWLCTSFCSISDLHHNRPEKKRIYKTRLKQARLFALCFFLSLSSVTRCALRVFLISRSLLLINELPLFYTHKCERTEKSVSAHTKPPCDILFWHARQLSNARRCTE